MNSKSKNILIAIIAVIIVLIVIIMAKKPETQEPAPAKLDTTTTETKTDASSITSEPAVSSETKPDDTQTTASQEKLPEGKKEGANSENAMNPEDQPRKFYVQDFQKLSQIPAGFKVENLELTEEGFKLKPAEKKEGEEAESRYGYLYSPDVQMDFDSNAVSPLWKENLPEGTSMLVEVQMSPDGKNWGIWNQIMVDDDSYGQIEQYYPDGRENPNYGYTPGGVLCWGLRQYRYFRYKVTLYSESDNSPVLESFRIFYQDSTLGEGHIAEVENENIDQQEAPANGQ